MEVWKDIPGYRGDYEISTYGNVRNTGTGKILRHVNTGHKNNLYPSVNLYYGVGKFHTKQIHRIMGLVFLGLDTTDKSKVVMHKDDNPTNTNLENLCIGTYKDNTQDMIKKKRDKMIKLTESEVMQIKKLKEQGLSNRKIGPMFGIHYTHVSNICNNKTSIWEGLGDKVNNIDHKHDRKLSTNDVITIRQRCENGDSYSDIAKDYGLDRHTPSKIHRRVIWKDI